MKTNTRKHDRKQLKSFTLELGHVVATQGISEAVHKGEDTTAHKAMVECLKRHKAGDWGDCCASDWSLNNAAAIAEGDQAERIISTYEKTPMGKIWIITEWDRSITTILFPSEY